MLDILAKTYSAGMRTNRHVKLGRHQQHREHLVDSAQTAAIYLTEVYRTGLQQLLEHHAAVTVFASGNSDRGNGTSDRRMAQYVVGGSGLLDPVRTEHR